MRTQITSFDAHFTAIHRRSAEFVSQVPGNIFYARPRELPRTFTMFTCGEYILRSAASVEQCFGGITRRLWDDPFEWTLPERLSEPAKVLEYLEEVDEVRRKGLMFLSSDDDLYKKIPAPVELLSVFDVLMSAMARAAHFQGRAFAVFQYYSDVALPKI